METKRQYLARKLIEYLDKYDIDIIQFALLLFVLVLSFMTIDTISNLKSDDPNINTKKISYGDFQFIVIVLIALFIYVKLNF
tara:strand:+ start:1845 stop:2090 length:246 start_codon:yes stop_codon:yes gene_type:complete